jgi:macrolide transport system ATP-binding/permease protein
MSWLRRVLFRNRMERDLDKELRFHFESQVADKVRSGISEPEARRLTQLEFGGIEQIKEFCRESRGTMFLELFLQDIRYGLRQLRKAPAFTLTTVSTLALGIGATTAIFAFVNAILIKPLPYKDPNRLAHLYEAIPLGPRFHLSYPDYLDWKRENKVFSSLDVYMPYGFMMSTADGLRQTDGAHVSAGFFRTLGVNPVLGRNFYEGEDRSGVAHTVLLSYSAWQRRYGLNPNVIGMPVVLDKETYTIIGVLPREFSFPPAEPADFWAILKPSKCRFCHGLFGVARLKDGVDFGAAFADIKTIAQNLSKQYPDSNREQWAYMLPLTEVIVGDIRPTLLVALCGAGLLLLIAGVNVANLMLVRAESRRREMAVRGALGASPRRLLTQFFREALLLALIGGALGVLGAQQLMRALAVLIPKEMMASMPYLHELRLDGTVALFASGLTALAALFFALTPILRFRATDISAGLSERSRGASGVTWRKFGSRLVVVELAMAMVLLAGAGLLMKSLYRLLHTDVGIEPDHVATVHVEAQEEKYGKPQQQIALVRRILQNITALPGVQSAGVTQKMPIEDADFTGTFSIPGQPDDKLNKEVAVRYVSAGYWSTLKTRLAAGRYFTDAEDISQTKVAIVNSTLGKVYFRGQNAVGKHIAFDVKEPLLIIGVIDDIQEGQLDAAPRAAVYMPFYQSPRTGFIVVTRTAQDDRSLLPTLTSALESIDPNMATYGAMTMDQKIHDAPATYLHRSSAWLGGGFAAVALVLGVIGLYGVVAYSVGQRKREIGVRMALGAQRITVYGMILSESGRLITVGLAIGVVTAIGAGSLMHKLLFGIRSWDAGILASVSLVLAVTSLLASFLPARRAASVNPTDALRSE